MPTYHVTLPDGHTYAVESAKELSDAEVYQHATAGASAEAPAESDPPLGGLLAQLGRGAVKGASAGAEYAVNHPDTVAKTVVRPASKIAIGAATGLASHAMGVPDIVTGPALTVLGLKSGIGSTPEQVEKTSDWVYKLGRKLSGAMPSYESNPAFSEFVVPLMEKHGMDSIPSDMEEAVLARLPAGTGGMLGKLLKVLGPAADAKMLYDLMTAKVLDGKSAADAQAERMAHNSALQNALEHGMK